MDEVRLEPDLVWSERFEVERERIRDVAPGELLGVFHVGSTAIPDLPTKPMLDVVAVYAGQASASAAADALVADGYHCRQDEPDWIQLTRPDDRDYPVFLHVRPRDAEAWRDQIVLREYLRDNPDARKEYECVKRAAAADHADDPEAYTDAKEAVVLSLEERAYEAGYADRLPNL
jgi:GrpB-like predicted nucleotidyltransferase (UPF0157 family)